MNLECPIINVIEMILRSKLCFFEGVMFKRTKIAAKFKEGKPRNGHAALFETLPRKVLRQKRGDKGEKKSFTEATVH